MFKPLPGSHLGSLEIRLGLPATSGSAAFAFCGGTARVALTDYAELVPLMERNIALNQLTGPGDPPSVRSGRSVRGCRRKTCR